jgi:transcriptional regulator with XRE-family HTH domain
VIALSIPTKIFRLLYKLDIDQKTFAKSIGTSDKVVSGWKTDRLKSYTKRLPAIAQFFDVPVAYFLEEGVFEQWEMILKYPASVSTELRKLIPINYFDKTVSDEKFLGVWLDVTMCYGITGEGELELIRWFYRNVESVSVTKEHEDIDEMHEWADVKITLLKTCPFYDYARSIQKTGTDENSAEIHQKKKNEQFLELFSRLDDKAQNEIVAEMLRRTK